MRFSEAAWATRPYGEIVEIAEQAGSVLVVPVGSLEQHGYHLPVATDTLLADAVAHGAATAADAPALVLPPVWTGLSAHHMPFGGTVTIGRETLATVLEEVAASALESGFDAVVYVNGHGGNTALVDAVSASVGAAHPAAEVVSLTYFALAAEIAAEVRDSEIGGMAHGGEFETSLLLHLYPEMVAMDRAEGDLMEPPYDRSRQDLFESGPVSAYRPFTAYSESGAVGDPTLGDAEKGQRLFDHLCATLAALVEEVHATAE
jgi:creatinine amidohydrolase